MSEEAKGKRDPEHSNSLKGSSFYGNAAVFVGSGRQINFFGISFSLGVLLIVLAVLIAGGFIALNIYRPLEGDKPTHRRTGPALSKTNPDDRFHVADNAGFLNALDPATGKELWTFHPPGTLRVSHKTMGLRIYVLATGRRTSGFYALDATSGDEIWSATERQCVGTPIGAASDTVLVDNGERVCALDEQTGEAKWFVDGWFRTHAIEANTLFSTDGTSVMATNLATGSLKWEEDTADGEELFAAKGILYIAGDNSLSALDGRTGKQRWNRASEGLNAQDVLLTETSLLVSDSRGLHSLDVHTGEDLWTQRITESGRPTENSGTLYVPSSEGARAFSKSTGAELWRQGEGASHSAYMHSHGKALGLLYLFGSEITAVWPNSGMALWKFNTPSSESPKPVLIEGAILIADGNAVTALDPLNGKVRWKHTAQGTVDDMSHSYLTALGVIDRIP
jgi:outer membrane protein assembly factor BamB